MVALMGCAFLRPERVPAPGPERQRGHGVPGRTRAAAVANSLGWSVQKAGNLLVLKAAIAEGVHR